MLSAFPGVCVGGGRERHSCQDLTTCLVSEWLHAASTKTKGGGDLRDIVGAFDRVSRDIFMMKLRECGLSSKWLAFALVSGASPAPRELKDIAFHGEVFWARFVEYPLPACRV